MIELLLLAMDASAGDKASTLPCLPVASDHLAQTSSAVDNHKALRKALGEPMPHAPTMVMMYGEGGHLANYEYSIVLVLGADKMWHGTAVGRSQIWIKDAPYTPMKRVEWTLDSDKSRQLDDALSRRCPFDRSKVSTNRSGPPPFGYIAQRIDVIKPGLPPVTYYASEGDGKIASLIRPPQ